MLKVLAAKVVQHTSSPNGILLQKLVYLVQIHSIQFNRIFDNIYVATYKHSSLNLKVEKLKWILKQAEFGSLKMSYVFLQIQWQMQMQTQR